MDEASISTMLRLDAIIAYAANNLLQFNLDLESRSYQNCSTEIDSSPDEIWADRAKPNRLTHKGGCIPPLFADRKKQYYC